MFYGMELLGCCHPSALYGKMQSEAQRENMILFAELFNRFSNIAVTRFDWEGLPNSVSERFLNQTLYLLGQAAFFKEPNMGFMALPCVVAGEYNAYYEPLRVEAYSFNFNRQLRKNDFVFIRNNPTCTPTAFSVFEYTRRMADVLRTIDVLCKKMKQPFFIVCEEKQKKTYETLLNKVIDNEIAVIGGKDFGLKEAFLDLVPMPINTDLTKLWEVFHSLETLLYTALGIDCVAQEKRERLLVDEVNANNMVTQMSIETNLKELQSACEKINEKYGLNVSVKAKGIEDYQPGVGPNESEYDNPTGGDDRYNITLVKGENR